MSTCSLRKTNSVFFFTCSLVLLSLRLMASPLSAFLSLGHESDKGEECGEVVRCDSAAQSPGAMHLGSFCETESNTESHGRRRTGDKQQCLQPAPPPPPAKLNKTHSWVWSTGEPCCRACWGRALLLVGNQGLGVQTLTSITKTVTTTLETGCCEKITVLSQVNLSDQKWRSCWRAPLSPLAEADDVGVHHFLRNVWFSLVGWYGDMRNHLFETCVLTTHSRCTECFHAVDH